MPPTEKVLPPIQESGFTGLHANPDVQTPTGFLSRLVNAYMAGSKVRQRPGLELLGAQLVNSPVQMLADFEELDGTRHTVAICNADLYEYNWGTSTWSSTDLALEGVTVDSSATIDWVGTRGRLIATDGVNKPFMWEPDTGTFTVLSNAPIANGVTLYYDKVFFFDLPGANGITFEWSDEGDPVNGYFAEDQSWQFTQTDPGAITCLAGMNEILPVFKLDSIASLRGEADENFQTQANREGPSDTEGTPGAGMVQLLGKDAYYCSSFGPRVLLGGYNVAELDLDGRTDNMLASVWDQFDPDEMAGAISFVDRQRKHVVWLMARQGETAKYSGIMYNKESGSLAEVEFDSSVFDFTAAASVETDTSEKRALLGTDDGKVYLYGDHGNVTDAGTSFTVRARSRHYGQSVGNVQKRLAHVALVLDVLSDTFVGEMRPCIDGADRADMVSLSKSFGYSTAGKRRYERGFNSVGYTVGWDVSWESSDGRADLLSSVTTITTTGYHGSRG